jgi:hypothetical protein
VNQDRITGGYILVSRRLLTSGIMEKPPLYMKLWIWMLMQASHKDHGNLKRGQFFTTIERMRDAMVYKAGYRIVRPSRKQIRGAYDFLTKGHMIGTTKVTRGLLITILNYDYYQSPENYERHNEGHNERSTRGTLKTRKDNKKGKRTPDLFSLKSRYPDEDLIDQVFQAIASTRKTNRVAESVLVAQLQKWEKYPVEQVEAGFRTYLDKGYADQGKREEYLLGIIRNQKGGAYFNEKPESRTRYAT